MDKSVSHQLLNPLDCEEMVQFDIYLPAFDDQMGGSQGMPNQCCYGRMIGMIWDLNQYYKFRSRVVFNMGRSLSGKVSSKIHGDS